MLIHKSLAGNLITKSIAMEITRMILLSQHGEVEVERNIPFNVSEDEETWTVTGSHNKDYNNKFPATPSWGGPVRMVIAKLDGQILSYTFGADLPWEKVPPKPEGDSQS
jgi:hypothetical protein